MRLVTFGDSSAPRVGVVVDDHVVDIGCSDPTLPTTMLELLRGGQKTLAAVRNLSHRADGVRHPLASVRLRAPVPRPPKFIALARNYADHAGEAGMEVPETLQAFNKQSTCVVGPFDDVHLPRVSASLDWEGELAFVIGTRARHVPAARAPGVIAGYTIVNDLSVREWQSRARTLTLGKSFDTHGPMGPWLVTSDELSDPHTLSVQTWVNGELLQNGNTKALIFNCWEVVEQLSEVFTLEPGDVVSTGTPAGVGGWMNPPRYLSVGDTVRIEIDRIGAIENRVIPEPEDFVAPVVD